MPVSPNLSDKFFQKNSVFLKKIVFGSQYIVISFYVDCYYLMIFLRECLLFKCYCTNSGSYELSVYHKKRMQYNKSIKIRICIPAKCCHRARTFMTSSMSPTGLLDPWTDTLSFWDQNLLILREHLGTRNTKMELMPGVSIFCCLRKI